MNRSLRGFSLVEAMIALLLLSLGLLGAWSVLLASLQSHADALREASAQRLVQDMAERICANAPLAVRESRKIVRAALTSDDDTLWDMSANAMLTLARTEDFAEGPRAFIEKRPPVWKGK